MVLPRITIRTTCVSLQQLVKMPRSFSYYRETTGLPSVNWWKGKLRPFESPISFAARFCELNGIHLKEFVRYFDCHVDDIWRNSHNDISRIATLLGEDIQIVQTVFASTNHFKDCGKYRLPHITRNSGLVRYCQRCAQLGYHSHLHEEDWLAKCPFHGISLDTIYPKRVACSNIEKRVSAIGQLMMSNCQRWPRSDEWEDDILNFKNCVYLKLLFTWSKNACEVAERFSRNQIWESDGLNIANGTSHKNFFGMLRNLEEMPELIKPFFSNIGDDWEFKIQTFPSGTRDELDRLNEVASFWDIYFVYKFIEKRTTELPLFLSKLHQAQRNLGTHREKCKCRWALEKIDCWRQRWISVDPNGWPYWQCKCPYVVALEMLELDGEKRAALVPSRQAWSELGHFTHLSRIVHDAGLVIFPPDISPSSGDDKLFFLRGCPGIKWNKESILTELLSATAEFEVESKIDEINRWLSSIDEGKAPTEWDKEEGLVRLHETSDGLLLVKWFQKKRVLEPVN